MFSASYTSGHINGMLRDAKSRKCWRIVMINQHTRHMVAASLTRAYLSSRTKELSEKEVVHAYFHILYELDKELVKRERVGKG